MQVALRAYEWLLLHWTPMDGRQQARRAAEAEAAGAEALAAARQQLYHAQLRREVTQLVEEYLPMHVCTCASSCVWHVHGTLEHAHPVHACTCASG